jgi:D-xylose 1-dehydrogenase (NADP+, D-xylono-1,5-lactone-forming)
MTTLRWGLLSTAHINRRLIPAIRAARRSRLVAVSSRDALRAQQYAAEWNIPISFGSYEEMLASPEIDAVYISLPNHLHAEWTIKALHAGKHVLCEKPFAITLEEVDGMISAANATGKVLAEAFMYRFNPQTLLLRDWMLSGRIGELKQIHGWFSFTMSGTENVRLVPDWGGGSLWDVGVYPISFAQYMVGSPPDWVMGTKTLGVSGVDNLFTGTLHYAGGQVTQFHSSFALPYATRMILFGSEGTLVIDHPFTGMDQHPHFKWIDAQGKEHTVKVPRNELYRCEVEAIESAVFDGNPPVVTLQESRNHIRTVLALIESAQTLQPVHLK